MILHRDGSSRRMGAESRPASVPDLARVLRTARSTRGLELGAVTAQTGIPVDLLQDLESGTVDRLPDRVAILKALSRYAAFLNLPGDQFVMTLVEHWPVVDPAEPAPFATVPNGPPQPAPIPTAGDSNASGAGDLSTRVVPLTSSGSGDPPTSVGLPIFEGRHNTTAPVPMMVADTGVTPAVRRRVASDGLLMVGVRALVVVAAILLLVGTAWLVVNHLHPQWLADLHLPYTSRGVGAVGTPGTTAKGTTTATAPTSATTRPPSTAPAHASMHLVSASGSQASFSVSSPLFSVRISAQGGDTWVSASGPLSSQPSFQGIVKEGQSEVVSANHQLTVQIGSTAARVAVQVNRRVIGNYVPPGAPFTMTFTTP